MFAPCCSRPNKQAARPKWWFTLLLLLFLGGLNACRKPFVPELDDIPAEVVIEAEVSNQAGPHQVKVYETRPYFQTGDFPPITGAQVILRNDQGQVDTLNEVEPGLYHTRPDLVGQVQSLYTLEVRLNEDSVYTAQAYLPNIAQVDSISYEALERAPDFEKGYYLTVYAQEPDTLGNNYLARLTRNDTLRTNAEDLTYGEDFSFNGSYVPFLLPTRFLPGDTARVELLGLDFEAYQWVVNLNFQLFAGSPIAPPGDNLRTNWTGGARGYFLAAGIGVDTTFVLPPYVE